MKFHGLGSGNHLVNGDGVDGFHVFGGSQPQAAEGRGGVEAFDAAGGIVGAPEGGENGYICLLSKEERIAFTATPSSVIFIF